MPSPKRMVRAPPCHDSPGSLAWKWQTRPDLSLDPELQLSPPRPPRPLSPALLILGSFEALSPTDHPPTVRFPRTSSLLGALVRQIWSNLVVLICKNISGPYAGLHTHWLVYPSGREK